MVLSGVDIDDRHIPELASVLPKTLANKLTVARTFGSKIVALTADERREVVMAIERSPGRLDDDLRYLILRQDAWRRS